MPEARLDVVIDSSRATSGAAEVARAAGTATASINRLDHWMHELTKISRENGEVQRNLASEILRTSGTADRAEHSIAAATYTFREQEKATTSLKEQWHSLILTYNQGLQLFDQVKSAFRQGYGLAKASAEAIELKDTFKIAMASVGKDADTALGKLRKMTVGMISDANLMTATLAAMNKGIAVDEGDVGKLLQISEAMADIASDGRTATQIFDQLVSTIARGSARGLHEFGLLPDHFKKAAETSDVLLGKQEMLNIVLSEGGKRIDLLGAAGGSAADNFAQLEAEFANLSVSVGENLIPVVTSAVASMRELIDLAKELGQWSRTAGSMSVAGQGPQTLEAAKVHIEELEREIYQRKKILPEITNGQTQYAAEIAAMEADLARTKLSMTSFTREAETKLKKEQLQFIDSLGKAAEDGIRRTSAGTAKIKKAGKEQKDAFEEIADNYKRFLFSDKGDMAGWGGILSQATSVQASLGAITLAYAKAMQAAKSAEAQFASVLKNREDAVESYMEGYLRSTSTADFQMGLMGSIPGMFGTGTKTLSFDQSEINERLRKDINAAREELENKLTISVKGAFEAGIQAAGRSGKLKDFTKVFADSLREQLYGALSTGLSSAIFGVSSGAGSFNLSSVLFGSGGVGGMLTGSGGGSGSSGGSGGGAGGGAGGGIGSSGILGGVMSKMFKPIFGANNALNWGALGSNLLTAGVAGFAVNRLFGQGGLFGGRVVHGQEQIQLSGDINSQVGQAQKQRDELIGSLVGVSQTTLNALQNMEFAYSWLAKHKSGNGITSKKTTTYEAVGVGAAQASIDMFMELSKKATAEAAARQFEIAIKQMTNPLEALDMQINDLTAAVNNATDASKTSAQQALTQAKAERAEYERAFRESWFQTRLSTAAVSAGNISVPSLGGSGAYGNLPNGIRANVTMQQPAHLTQMDLVQSQAQRDYSLAKLQLAAQSDPSKVAEYLSAKVAYLSDSMKTFDALMKDAATRARNATQGSKEAEAAVADFAAAQAAYYNTDIERLQVEKQKQAEVRKQQEQKQYDILSTLVTAMGEARNVAGLGKVLVIRPDDPNFTAYLKEIRDGLDAEGQRVFDQILESKYGKNRGFSV